MVFPITRRSFCRGLASLVLSGAVLLNPGYSAEQERVETTQLPSLTRLVKEGLPKEFKELGFNLSVYTPKKSDSDVIIIGEHHDDNSTKLIEYLINEYGIDSIGLDSFWGEFKDYENRVYYEEVFGKDLIPKLGKINEDENKDKLTIKDTLEKLYPDIDRISKDHNLNLYGIEDKDLLLKNYFNAYLIYLIRKIGDNPKKYDDIDNIKRYEELYHIFRCRFPDLGNIKKGITLRQYVEEYKNDRFSRDKEFNSIVLDSLIKERNKLFAENIERYMRRFKSKRSLVITGFNHTDMIPLSGYDNIQKLILYTSLVITTPGIKIKDPTKTKKGD
ncbi:MAG: hypothetical protein Q8N99_04875 [Nanoarchaeota archaeon]|nr:hypothetical protein [Nanoarchaeota archaeon]